MKFSNATALSALAVAAALALAGPARADQEARTADGTVRNDLGYLLYTPEDYETSGETYPLVIWLHGGDQSGSDIEKVKTGGLPKMAAEGRDFPFLIFSPQNPDEELLFPIERFENALEGVLADYRIDPARVYLVGYSRGAFAAWAMAEQFPDRFAAVVPIAGGGNRHYLNRTNENAAFWVFHGERDDTIPLSDSVIMFQRLREIGRDARLTVAEGVDHGGIEAAALDDPQLFEWLLAQRLDEPEGAAAQ